MPKEWKRPRRNRRDTFRNKGRRKKRARKNAEPRQENSVKTPPERRLPTGPAGPDHRVRRRALPRPVNALQTLHRLSLVARLIPKSF